MKLRGMIGALVTISMFACAATAQAGLDFANTATAVGAVSTPNTRFNGVDAATFGTQALASGFQAPGANQVVISAPSAAPLVPNTAALDFKYIFAGEGGQGFQYSFANKAGDYGLVLQMGDIAVGGADFIFLSTVQFSEVGTTDFGQQFGINRSFGVGDSGTTLFIDIPDSAIPNAERELVDVVRLNFIFTGSATSFGINAVANPEPGTIALFGLGLLGLAGVVRRRRQAPKVETAA